MCSISGVSFVPGSTLDRRKLATALLSAGESRGRDASGMGWVSPDGDGMYKKDVAGGQLYVGKMPVDASAMILHTRQATHGKPEVNENNHPVLSPSGNVRLVHNGVIYNHQDIRELLGKDGKALPEVDSSVIPALIEVYGLSASSELAGYAAAAWFDRETDDTIHLARFKQAPVHYAQLWDGSIAFASTAEILGSALNKAGVAWYGNYPTPFDSMTEGEYVQLLGGEFIIESTVEWNDRYSYSGYDYTRVTAGKESVYGRGATAATKATSPAPASTYIGSPSGVVEQNKIDVKTTAQSLFKTPEQRFEDEPDIREFTEAEFEAWVRGDAPAVLDDELDDDDEPMHHVTMNNTGVTPMFYSMGHDGDYSSFLTLAGLVQSLSWSSGLTDTENYLVGPDEGQLRWVNHIADIGSLSADGAEQFSWVASDSDMSMFSRLLPIWVRDGVSKLRTLVGS